MVYVCKNKPEKKRLHFLCFFISKPFKQSLTKLKPSFNGIPIAFEYSNGAAPVPPSPPSTAIKSG